MRHVAGKVNVKTYVTTSDNAASRKPLKENERTAVYAPRVPSL